MSDSSDRGAGAPYTLEDAAVRIGRYQWVEMRCFELMGAWASTVPELDVKLHLGAHAGHHAWHAELWHDLLPAVHAIDRDELVRPASEQVEAFFAALAEPEAPEHTIEKLVGLHRVLLPHKVAAYSHHLERTSEVADAPVIRALGFVLRDELDDWQGGTLLLASLLRTEDQVQRAAAHQARLESLLVVAGGICGPGTLVAVR